MGETSLIAGLQLEVLTDRILVVELHFPRTVVHVTGAALIIIGVRLVSCRCTHKDTVVFIEVVVVRFPAMIVQHKVQICFC